MASLLYTLEGWLSSPSANNVARSFNNDTLTWSTAIAAPPFTGQVASSNASFRQQGGWDGSFWYVIGPDGKLYRYNPSGNTWSAALVGGSVIIPGTVEDQHWAMASDGKFVYLVDSGSGGFRRYDPGADTLTARAALPGTVDSRLFLCYDGVDALYGYKGGATGQFYKYTISADTWATIATNATIISDVAAGFFPCAMFLQGKLWVAYGFNGNTAKAFAYTPGANTWAAKAVQAGISFNTLAISRYGEATDSSFRLWLDGNTAVSYLYSIAGDTWTADAPTPAAFQQGGNWAVSRLFSPGYSYYEADGVTPLNPTKNLQGVVVGGTISYQIKVKANGAVGGGATVSIPSQINTDAEDVVTICGTVGGTYGTSFVTAALTSGQTFDVFIKVIPTAGQSLGLAKLWNMRVV